MEAAHWRRTGFWRHRGRGWGGHRLGARASRANRAARTRRSGRRTGTAWARRRSRTGRRPDEHPHRRPRPHRLAVTGQHGGRQPIRRDAERHLDPGPHLPVVVPHLSREVGRAWRGPSPGSCLRGYSRPGGWLPDPPPLPGPGPARVEPEMSVQAAGHIREFGAHLVHGARAGVLRLPHRCLVS